MIDSFQGSEYPRSIHRSAANVRWCSLEQQAWWSCVPGLYGIWNGNVLFTGMWYGTDQRSSLFVVQVTFQAVNIDEARHLYDQLAVVCPIMVHDLYFSIAIVSLFLIFKACYFSCHSSLPRLSMWHWLPLGYNCRFCGWQNTRRERR